MEKFIELAGVAADDLEGKEIIEGVVSSAQEIRGSMAAAEGMTAASAEGMSPELAAMEASEEIDIDVYEAGEVSKAGGLSACSYKCIMSHCQPVDLMRNISTKNPHSANSASGHR